MSLSSVIFVVFAEVGEDTKAIVCSLTTIIGYGSLLISENLAIRGFGLASLIGEIARVATALILVPALLAVRHNPAVAAGESVAA